MAHTLLKDEAGSLGGDFASGVAQNLDSQVRTIFCWGTFDGAQVQVEYGPSENGPWFYDQSGQSNFVEKGMVTRQLGASLYFRAVIKNAGASTLLDLVIF